MAVLTGQFSENEIAAGMGMSRRTLHRRLCSLGIRFQQILDEVRCGFAQQLMSNTRLSIGEIALFVGYADPSILTRAFRRWTGVGPAEWLEHCFAINQVNFNNLENSVTNFENIFPLSFQST
ncbi:MAG TPA: AraC family transcriptional regulator [Bryobacteraceae bacterium]|nr:AraC family transcriptional regulator [Bryobacteraceae bacterium]